MAMLLNGKRYQYQHSIYDDLTNQYLHIFKDKRYDNLMGVSECILLTAEGERYCGYIDRRGLYPYQPEGSLRFVRSK